MDNVDTTVRIWVNVPELAGSGRWTGISTLSRAGLVA